MPRASKKPKAGIYQILHIESGQQYVGQSLDIEKRFKEHYAELNFRRHFNYKLQSLWDDYGPYAFSFDILELAPEGMAEEDRQQWLLDTEICYWEEYSSTRLNSIKPEFVMTGGMRKEYKRKREEQRKAATKEITAKIKQANVLLDKVKQMPRPPLEPVTAAKEEFRRLDHEKWKATGWRVLIYWNKWLVNRDALASQLERARSQYKTLLDAYREKDVLRRQILDARRKLYNSYPGRKKPTVEQLLREMEFIRRRSRTRHS